MKFDINIIQMPGAKLSEEALPAADLKIQKTALDQMKVSGFERAIRAFAEHGDSIISEICTGLENQQAIKTSVVLSNGLPDPYEAWTAKWNGETSIFFNLDLWDHEKIEFQAVPILKHEISHLVLEPFLQSEKGLSFSEQLERIVLDEGIAHFIGFSQNREALLERWFHNWQQAELELANTFKVLNGAHEDVSLKRQLLLKAQTGPFWDKFGAIAGMFRAAKVYKQSGSNGLIAAIRNMRLL